MNNKLVSICVITYNSSKTIISTLNSIFFQTYKEIELIVSDDHSSDNTIKLVEEWIINNSKRFINTKLITTEKNTGVTGNVNRACKAANGYYIKDIAGDDELLPEYVETCIKYLESNTNIEILFTKIKHKNELNKEIKIDDDYTFYSLSVSEQFEYVKCKGLPSIPTPSVIYKKTLLEKFDFFDERIPMWEDGPFYFKLLENNIKLYLLDNFLVMNRLLATSISHQMSPRHKRSIALFYFLYTKRFDNNLYRKLKNIIKFSLFYFSNIQIIDNFLNKVLKK